METIKDVTTDQMESCFQITLLGDLVEGLIREGWVPERTAQEMLEEKTRLLSANTSYVGYVSRARGVDSSAVRDAIQVAGAQAHDLISYATPPSFAKRLGTRIRRIING